HHNIEGHSPRLSPPQRKEASRTLSQRENNTPLPPMQTLFAFGVWRKIFSVEGLVLAQFCMEDWRVDRSPAVLGRRMFFGRSITCLWRSRCGRVAEQQLPERRHLVPNEHKEDQTAGNGSIRNVEDPPPLENKAAEMDVGNVHVEKVHH